MTRIGNSRMRKVTDSNYLQALGLREYLAKSPDNFAVITDYASMEAYKGDTLASIYRSMEILAEFPRQVIVLKGTMTVCGLKGRRSGLQRRLIDEDQTRGFPVYCRRLEAAKRGNLSLQRQLLNHGRAADEQMSRMLADAAKFSDSLELIADTYAPDELHILRRDVPYTEALFEKVMKNIMMLAAMMFADHPRITQLPSPSELPYTFIFRAALCAYLLALRWVSVGGAKNVKAERIRNDLVDVNFAAFATYFDGLLTADSKAAAIYRDADYLLRHFSVVPELSARARP